MKNCLKFSLAIFFMVAFTDIHAQIKPGYIFGLNLSTLTLKTKGISSNPKTLVGIHYGGCYDIPLPANFTLQPGLLFSAKGSDYKIDTVEYSISPIYIEVSTLAIYTFGSGMVKISLFCGPYFACGVGGYKIEPGGALKNITFGSKEKNDLKPFDVGINSGAAINIKGLAISVQYGIGLANISPVTTTVLEMKNKVIGISISSSFAGK